MKKVSVALGALVMFVAGFVTAAVLFKRTLDNLLAKLTPSEPPVDRP